MRSIDLVKHQTRILPGLEEAAHAVIGRLNESRKLLKLSSLILVEDQTAKAHYVTVSKEAAEQIRQSAIRYQKRKAEAEAARARIGEKQTRRAEKTKLTEFRRKLKTGTLIERPDPAIDEWNEGSRLKPALQITARVAKRGGK
jgi:hypothetical protein